MTKLENLKKLVNDLDVMSDEFFELYKHISSKYYDVEKPDDYQKAVNLIRLWLDTSSGNFEDHVIVTTKIVEQLFMMKKENTPSCTGTIGFDDCTYYFDIYTTENSKDEMNKLIMKAGKSIKNGTFGKSYFNKKK